MIEKIIKFLKLFFKKLFWKKEIKENYEKIKITRILNKNELFFYNQLTNFLQNKEIFIFSKVRLLDFLDLQKYYNFEEKTIIKNKVKSKHIDFIITNKNSEILYLIELDGFSHQNNKKTIENDKFKNKLFNILNLKLVRFKVKNWNYDFKDIIL